MNTISITGNPIRDQLIVNAVVAARNDDGVVTIATIQSLLPADFDLSEDELRDVLAALDGPAGRPIPDAETIAAIAAPVAEPPNMAREEAAERVRMAHQNLANLRAELIAAGNRQRKARADLASAVTAFVAGQQPMSREQLVRDTIKADLAYRQGVKDGTISPRQRPRPGRSAIDLTAFYGRGGSPAGGGSAFRRGGMTTATAARAGFQKAMPAPTEKTP